MTQNWETALNQAGISWREPFLTQGILRRSENKRFKDRGMNPHGVSPMAPEQ